MCTSGLSLFASHIKQNFYLGLLTELAKKMMNSRISADKSDPCL